MVNIDVIDILLRLIAELSMIQLVFKLLVFIEVLRKY